MCGIVGQLGLHARPIQPARVLAAAQVLRHRGPDSEGYLLVKTESGACELRNGPETAAGIEYSPVDAPCGFTPDLVLGHRRLAILDLSPRGHEPMGLAGRDDLWVVFNGELYNYLEIRAELQVTGRVFTTECDVEILLHAYDAWGPACLDRFLGMFAFALWDQRRRWLWCARDRFGIKPFYYASSEGVFSFASELKAFRVLAPEACAPDVPQVVWAIQNNNTYNPPRTFLAGVRELPGGCSLLVQAGEVGEPRRWYTLSIERAHMGSDTADPAGTFRLLMQDSVRLHLRSDVPVGSCLSGGLDSSTVVALATGALRGGRMNTFSALYPVKGYDESHFVDLIVDRFHTIRHVTTPQPETNFLDHLSRLVWHQDSPVMATGVVSQDAVMRLAAGQVTVLLDGQGGDELLAGYLIHAVRYSQMLLRSHPLRWAREFPGFAWQAWQNYLPALTLRELLAMTANVLRHGRNRPHVLTPDAEQLAADRQAERVPGELPGADPLNNYLYQAVTCLTIPMLLHFEDRSSMAHGIEARVPLLDHRLVEFALSIPAEQKIQGATGKVVLRRAMEGILPPDVVQRRDKLGYPTPFAAWSRTSLRDELNTFLEDRVFKRDWYDSASLRRLWRQHLAGQVNADGLIHNVITAELWFDQFGQ